MRRPLLKRNLLNLVAVVWLGLSSARSGGSQLLLLSTNVGNAPIQPSLLFSNDTYTLSGAGIDIFCGSADQFAFIYENISGDTEIVARVDSLNNTDPDAKAGVMIRAGLTSNAPQATMVVTPGNGAAFLTRSASGEGTARLSSKRRAIAPQWSSRLIRQGNYFTGYYSTDGLHWRQGGSLTLNMPTNIQVGLAVCSRMADRPATAVFSRVGFLDAVRRPGVTVLQLAGWEFPQSG